MVWAFGVELVRSTSLLVLSVIVAPARLSHGASDGGSRGVFKGDWGG